jgi:hypothetical protein
VVSGKAGCDFVEERIMKPLEMDNSVASFDWRHHNIIAPCTYWRKIKSNKTVSKPTFDAAAGIYSACDLSKWAIMQMNNKYGPDNKQLFSEKSILKCGHPNYNTIKTTAHIILILEPMD